MYTIIDTDEGLSKVQDFFEAKNEELPKAYPTNNII